MPFVVRTACRMTTWQIFAQPVFDLLESKIKVRWVWGRLQGFTQAGTVRPMPPGTSLPANAPRLVLTHEALAALCRTGLAHPPSATACAPQGRARCS